MPFGRQCVSLLHRCVHPASLSCGSGSRATPATAEALFKSFKPRGGRAFCAGTQPLAAGLEAPRPRPGGGKKKQQSSNTAYAVGACTVSAVAAYGLSSDVREIVNGSLSDVAQAFEDFNDSSREFFESIGDSLVTQHKEPWLLELKTMNYPENIPTLVLDVDKVILLLDHDSRQGWHVIKRPFVDQFFKEISHYFEVVLFSDDVFPVALDIAHKMNLPVTGVLHRDFCKKKRSHYVKDISKLGRNLERVLIIDHDPEAFKLQPENGLLIRPFDGDERDTELLDLLEFLKAAATSNTDIRDFVKKFGGGDEDIGKRYLLFKQGQDAKVESRRSFGRAFASGGRGFPSSPPTGTGPGGMLR